MQYVSLRKGHMRYPHLPRSYLLSFAAAVITALASVHADRAPLVLYPIAGACGALTVVSLLRHRKGQ